MSGGTVPVLFKGEFTKGEANRSRNPGLLKLKTLSRVKGGRYSSNRTRTHGCYKGGILPKRGSDGGGDEGDKQVGKKS